MKSLTHPGRQVGYKAMEETITPLARAMRRFSAGKPAFPKNTPLAVVSSATEQRERLRQKLDSEPGLDSPQIEAVAIILQLDNPGLMAMDEPLEDAPLIVEEGTESEAVAYLEDHLKCGNTFAVSGFLFVVRSGDEKRVFTYKVARTPEGDAALNLASERLIPKGPR
jgi:hypothetical protein